MDEYYRRITALNEEYIQLTNEFIDGLNKDRPVAELAALKEKIRLILEETERLEKARSAAADKDPEQL